MKCQHDVSGLVEDDWELDAYAWGLAGNVGVTAWKVAGIHPFRRWSPV